MLSKMVACLGTVSFIVDKLLEKAAILRRSNLLQEQSSF